MGDSCARVASSRSGDPQILATATPTLLLPPPSSPEGPPEDWPAPRTMKTGLFRPYLTMGTCPGRGTAHGSHGDAAAKLGG
jgi:hypothetical protein